MTPTILDKDWRKFEYMFRYEHDIWRNAPNIKTTRLFMAGWYAQKEKPHMRQDGINWLKGELGL